MMVFPNVILRTSISVPSESR